MNNTFKKSSITVKLLSSFSIVGVSLIVLCLLALNILPFGQTARIVLVVILFLAGLATAIVITRYFRNNIIAHLQALTTGLNMLAEGNLSYFDKDVWLDSSSTETFTQSEAFNNLIKRSKEKVEDTRQIANGDLTTHIHMQSDNDELGQALLDVVHNTHRVVSAIFAAADQVSSGSNLVADSSFSLSQGATVQASSIQQLTASLVEIASQTNLNAKNAEKANDLSQKAKVNAAEGNEHMQDMLNAMDEINDSSANIGKIIKVIDDIAFQTNILALNAAVEAARAGQHGKGFAVVAEEVRNLAAKSAQAAQETTNLIEGSKRKVESGTKIARDTAEALREIVTHVEIAADLIHSIAQASNEQALSIEQINSGIQQVSEVVQTNAATSQESAAASEQLSGQAAQLKESVSVFKLKRIGGASRQAKADRSPESIQMLNQLSSKPQTKQKISLSEGDFGKY
ncbi:methyl-accepting chemotaxis protein [Oscillospiraceae bacterium WX1]